MSKILYLEGGGDSKELHARCREGFRKLLEKSGFKGRMPRLVACGGRGAAFDDFKTGHDQKQKDDFIAMLIDSETTVTDVDATWEHLQNAEGWTRPANTDDAQVLLMTTCMESWIVTDRGALRNYYGSGLQESALPPLNDLEERSRDDVQNRLVRATRNCSNVYAKGERSFEVLAVLEPAVLEAHLPSFARVRRVLNQRL